MARGLPSFEPYLRAKGELPEKAISDLNNYYDELRRQYGGRPKKKGGRS